MREIVLDTETTGLDPAAGHRIVEIACLELLNHIPTGRTYQCYVNPERDVPSDAFAVHGLSVEFLSDKPRFAEIADKLAEFIADAPLVIHNAEFDVRFLNAEFQRLARPPLTGDRVVDTLQMARQKFPGAPASLDALCRRFAIDNSTRTKHGALLDTELLADVYLELIGGRQAGLELMTAARATAALAAGGRTPRVARPHAASDAELAAHAALVATLKDPIWSS
jgi:DNA polymerase III subunit epsilon